MKLNNLYDKISKLIESSRNKVISSINIAMVYTYFEIGRMIVEEEQKGNEKAKYGKYLIENLAKKLTDKFGNGFSKTNLKQMRQFYLVYSKKQIGQTVSGEFTLSWSHYIVLLKIDNPEERSFYEIEAKNNNWSVRELERQYHSSLYERLALSRDKNMVMELSKKGNIIKKSSDIIKSPFVLEFLGLEEKASYSESDLESAIITKLQNFLLELGKGFLFEARQKRFTFDNDNFYVDLVFYNRILKCYVLIDLKIDKVKHQDLGQMQMYVNYFDRYIKLPEENPTIGILLCKEKSDALVELTLPKNSNIHASEYKLYLPDKKLLQNKLQEFYESSKDNVEFERNDKMTKNDSVVYNKINQISNNITYSTSNHTKEEINNKSIKGAKNAKAKKSKYK